MSDTKVGSFQYTGRDLSADGVRYYTNSYGQVFKLVPRAKSPDDAADLPTSIKLPETGGTLSYDQWVGGATSEPDRSCAALLAATPCGVADAQTLYFRVPASWSTTKVIHPSGAMHLNLPSVKPGCYTISYPIVEKYLPSAPSVYDWPETLTPSQKPCEECLSAYPAYVSYVTFAAIDASYSGCEGAAVKTPSPSKFRLPADSTLTSGTRLNITPLFPTEYTSIICGTATISQEAEDKSVPALPSWLTLDTVECSDCTERIIIARKLTDTCSLEAALQFSAPDGYTATAQDTTGVYAELSAATSPTGQPGIFFLSSTMGPKRQTSYQEWPHTTLVPSGATTHTNCPQVGIVEVTPCSQGSTSGSTAKTFNRVGGPVSGVYYFPSHPNNTALITELTGSSTPEDAQRAFILRSTNALPASRQSFDFSAYTARSLSNCDDVSRVSYLVTVDACDGYATTGGQYHLASIDSRVTLGKTYFYVGNQPVTNVSGVWKVVITESKVYQTSVYPEVTLTALGPALSSTKSSCEAAACESWVLTYTKCNTSTTTAPIVVRYKKVDAYDNPTQTPTPGAVTINGAAYTLSVSSDACATGDLAGPGFNPINGSGSCPPVSPTTTSITDVPQTNTINCTSQKTVATVTNNLSVPATLSVSATLLDDALVCSYNGTTYGFSASGIASCGTGDAYKGGACSGTLRAVSGSTYGGAPLVLAAGASVTLKLSNTAGPAQLTGAKYTLTP